LNHCTAQIRCFHENDSRRIHECCVGIVSMASLRHVVVSKAVAAAVATAHVCAECAPFDPYSFPAGHIYVVYMRVATEAQMKVE
jgi:hypothetical protein